MAGSPPPAPPLPNVATLLLDYLALEGVTHVFGVPGGGLANLLTAAMQRRDRLRYVIARQETAAAYMADGYWRATGRLGVVMVTSGPGATNALTGTMNADESGSALLAVTGEVAEQFFGRGYLQEGIDGRLDVDAVYAAATASSAVIANPSDAQALIERALRAALSRPRRAAHLSLPNDVGGTPLPTLRMPARPAAYRTAPGGAPAGEVAALTQALLACRRPVILLGAGCREALRGPALAALRGFVERFAIPVMTTADGKGLFPETHALSLRVYGIADCLWPQYWLTAADGGPAYDGLLVVGSSLGELSTNTWLPMLQPQGPLLQVDLDAQVIGRGFPVTQGLVAEAGAFLEAMADFGAGVPPDEAAVAWRRGAVAALKAAHSPFLEPAQYASDTAPLQPAALLRVLNDGLPDDALVFVDAGNCVGWSAHYGIVDPPREMHSCLTMGPMGFGVAAVVGAKLGAPQRCCVALVGDGAFLMHGSEVSTAAQAQAGAIWVVLQDGVLNMVAQGQAHFFASSAPPAVWDELYALGDNDLVGFATALGARAVAVDDPLQAAQALRDAIAEAASGRPQVIVARIDRAPLPPYYNPQYAPPPPAPAPAPPAPKD